jgi:hypothetical protein
MVYSLFWTELCPHHSSDFNPLFLSGTHYRIKYAGITLATKML